MRKMSAKRIVLSHYPKTTIETQRQHLRPSYYLVRKLGRTQQMWPGCGDTPAKAWADAADRLQLTTLKVTP